MPLYTIWLAMCLMVLQVGHAFSAAPLSGPTGQTVRFTEANTIDVAGPVKGNLFYCHEQGAAPSTPASGDQALYCTSAGWFIKDAADVVYGPLGSAAGAVPVAFVSLPADPEGHPIYWVTDQNGSCTASGTSEGMCVWDGDSWGPIGASSTVTLQTACAAGTNCALTSLPESRPLILAPNGLTGVQLRTYHQSGAVIEDCIDGTTGLPCLPSSVPVYPGQTQCLALGVMDTPAANICLASFTNVDGASVAWSDRGLFADRPTPVFPDAKYTVTDCLTDGCTAGGGTIKIDQIWNGSAWINIGPIGAGTGDINQVWGCTTGDCSALTGASGDTMNAASADSVIPQPVSATLPATCTEGQQYQDTDAGGSETYKCTATNTWVKLAAVKPWEILFSAVGLIPDGTNCVTQATTQINSGPNTLPIVCADAPGTLELNFLSPSIWVDPDRLLTVSFIVSDTTSAGHVWSANVEAQCRSMGVDTISNTWGTAVAATVTMTTANIPYKASAVVVPHQTCGAGDIIFVRATINSAGAHTDASARILGGSIIGNTN